MKLVDLLNFIGKGEKIRVYSINEKRQLYKGSKEGVIRNSAVTSRNVRKSGVSVYRSDRWEVGINIEVF